MQNLNHKLDTAVWGHTAVISLCRGNRLFKKEAMTSVKKKVLNKYHTVPKNWKCKKMISKNFT